MFTLLDAMFRPQMIKSGLTFTCTPCEPDVALMADQTRVVQVCANLLTNAMRATSAGGSVTLTCDADDEAVTMSVTDTGVGIPADKLTTIFSPFTQLGRALTRRAKARASGSPSREAWRRRCTAPSRW